MMNRTTTTLLGAVATLSVLSGFGAFSAEAATFALVTINQQALFFN